MTKTFSMSFLTLAVISYSGQSLLLKPGGTEEKQETCATLRNHETHSSVEVSVGNPPQSFSLIADTGSDKVIVKDCACKHCRPEWGPSCFLGPHHSSSFNVSFVAEKPQQGGEIKEQKEAQMVISFGSGAVATRIGSDEVRLGPVKSYMKDGLLLIIDEQLDINERFEGILGLGRPDYKANPKAERQMAKSNDFHVPDFFEQAQVRRFSMCFNHQADGVLGMNTKAQANPMSSVGQMHWGLDFHGISVGNQQMKLDFCDPGSKRPDQQTACGLIPDSGTTLIAAAQQHLEVLFEAVCNNWPRCKKAQKQLEAEVAELAKKGKLSLPDGLPDGLLDGDGHVDISPVETLQQVLTQCSEWMSGVDLDTEMPSLTFHVAGANGNKDQLVLHPRTYVLLEDAQVELPKIVKGRNGKKHVKKVQEQRQVCTMAFTPLDYETQDNGPVWIMGMPLFFEHTAHYDRGNGREQGVTMAFTPQDQEGCGECESYTAIKRESQSSLITKGVSTRTGMESLNRLTKKPLIRHFNRSQSI